MEATVEKYRSTESKYKGGAHEMYITYNLESKTSSGSRMSRPRVKRVYIAGTVKDWKRGTFKKRTGREVKGVLIEYEQTRTRYQRQAYTAKRGEIIYEVGPASVGGGASIFKQVVEVPEKATNVHFYNNVDSLPAEYRHTLQRVR